MKQLSFLFSFILLSAHMYGQMGYYFESRFDSEEISNSSLQWHYSVVNVLTGNTILENDAEGTTTTFDLSKYPSGVYVIKVEMDDQTVSKKISI